MKKKKVGSHLITEHSNSNQKAMESQHHGQLVNQIPAKTSFLL